MAPRADSAALNVQPRQRRTVYEGLAKVPEGRSVKQLLLELDIAERDLRETLVKLDNAGLAQRFKGVWRAIPLEPDSETPGGPETETDAGSPAAT